MSYEFMNKKGETNKGANAKGIRCRFRDGT